MRGNRDISSNVLKREGQRPGPKENWKDLFQPLKPHVLPLGPKPPNFAFDFTLIAHEPLRIIHFIQ